MDIASLKLKIDSTDAKTAQRDLENLEKSATKTEQAAYSLGKGIGLAMVASTAAAGAVVLMTRNSINAADAMNDLHLKTGLAFKDLAAYDLLARQSGTDANGMAEGFKNLGKYMTEHSNKLRSIGVTSKDQSTAMGQFADVIASIEDPALRTSLAMEVLGKSGVNLLPALMGGSEAFKNAGEETSKYGEILERIAPQADAFNDKLEILKTRAKEAGASLAEYFLPSLNEIAATFIKTEKQSGSLVAALTALGIAERKLLGVETDEVIITQKKVNDLFKESYEIKTKIANFEASGMTGTLVVNDLKAKKAAIDAVIKVENTWLANQAIKSNAEKSAAEVTKKLTKEQEKAIRDAVTGPKKKDGSAKDQVTTEQEYMISVGRTTEEIIKKAKAMELENELIGKTASEIMQITNARYDEKIAIKEIEAAQLQGIKGKEAEVFLIKEQIKAMEQLKSAGTARESLSKIADENKKAAEKSERAWQNFSDNVQNVFANSLYNGMMGTFGGIEEMFKQMILRMIAEAAAAQMMISMKSGFSGLGGLFGSSTGGGENYGSSGISESAWISGAKADGGPVSGGSSYLVGERGPEIFTPSSTGNITPNNKIGGGGTTINDNTVINIDSRSDRMQVMKDVQKMIENGHAKLIDNLQRQGQLA